MANEQNLKPPRNTNEARERGKKGGKASGKSRRERRAMRDTFATIMQMTMKDGAETSIEDIRKFGAVKGYNISVQAAIAMSVAQKALKGDIRAAELMLEILGEKPPGSIQISTVKPETVAEIEKMVQGDTE